MPAPANGTVRVRESLGEEDELWPNARRKKGRKRKKKPDGLTNKTDRKRPVLVEVVRQTSTSTTAAEKANETTTANETEAAVQEENNSTSTTTTALPVPTSTSTEQDFTMTTLVDNIGEVSATMEDVSTSTSAAAADHTTTSIELELSTSTAEEAVQPTVANDDEKPRVVESLRQLASDHKLLLLPIVLLGAIFALF